MNGLLTLLAFLGVLWSISPRLVLAAMLYAVAGSLGTIFLGHRLVPLNNRQLQKEADFRFALGRVRERTGTESSPDGQGNEKSRLLGRLDALVANFREVIKVTRNVGFFTRALSIFV
jgi:putative ATP-binding cassette transporter